MQAVTARRQSAVTTLLAWPPVRRRTMLMGGLVFTGENTKPPINY
jgi:hypothetical protein